ncbi:MAG: hypothetical protein WKF68_09930 [Daejeonella sp.]
MRAALTCLFTILTVAAFSQPQRNVRFRTFSRDSINLHMDENYALIEDSCSSIVRYGHFRINDRKFFGPFKDINKFDPGLVLAEGQYTDDGKLDGKLKMNYLNGEPLAEGSFDKGKMTGEWVIYYPGNKKRLEFKNAAEGTYILNAWNPEGKQTVIDGAGFYRSDLDMIFWEGKLVNGKPDGVWKSKKTDDRSGTVIINETYKNNVFRKGSSIAGNYSDASRIVLAGENLLPINNATAMRISSSACDPFLVA